MNRFSPILPVFLILLVFVCTDCFGITIWNEAEETLFIRAYYCIKKHGEYSGQSATAVKTLNKGDSLEFERPDRKWGPHRELYFSEKSSNLSDAINDEACRKVPHVKIGSTHGKNFYLAREKGLLKGFNTAKWKVVKPLMEKAKNAANTLVGAAWPTRLSSRDHPRRYFPEGVLTSISKEIRNEMRDHPHSAKQATVRQSAELCPDEIAFRKERAKKNKKALESLLGLKLSEEEVPVIGITVSGGGYRAMIGFVGLIMGIQESGLYDAVTYISTLSGSTWALAPWFAQNVTIGEYREKLIPIVENGLNSPHLKKDETRKIALRLLAKRINNQPVTIVDLWGSLLAHKLLKPLDSNFLNPGISMLAERTMKADDPMPIFTAVCNNLSPDSNFEWFEFTPFEMGSDYLKAFVPIWAYGRKFKDGKSQDFNREQSMAFGLGVFGSAFSLRVGDVIDHTPLGDAFENRTLKKVLSPIINQFHEEIEAIRKKFIIPGGSINNFAIGLSATPKSAAKEKIKLSDGGHHANNPLPPLLRKERALDLIIVCDFSKKVAHGAPQLQPFLDYCRRKGAPFPKGNWSLAGKENLTIFGDPKDLKSPVIVYIPRILNKELPAPFDSFDPQQAIEDYAGTRHFSYSAKHVREWSDYVKLDLKNLSPKLLELIRARIEAKRKH